MSTGQVGTGLGNEYGISGMLWHLPCPVHSSRPYNLYQDHYKGILLVLLLSGIPLPPPPGTSLQLTHPNTGFSASRISLLIFSSAYHDPGPHVRVGRLLSSRLLSLFPLLSELGLLLHGVS